MLKTDVAPGLTVLYGPPGSGKSSMAITWPPKVVFFDFDLGFDRAHKSDELLASGNVVYHKIEIPARSFTTRYEKLVGYKAAWIDFTTKFVEACEDEEVGSIVVDTCTMEWSLNRDAYLEELQEQNPNRKQLLQREYGEPNSRQKIAVAAAKSYGKHLVWVHHETDMYDILTIGGQVQLDSNNDPKRIPTGEKTPDGFRYSLGLADWVLHSRLQFDRKSMQNGQKPEAKVFAMIEKSARGLHLLGEEIGSFTFKSLETLIKLGPQK